MKMVLLSFSCLVFLSAVLLSSKCAVAADRPTLKHSDVVFMYTANDPDRYIAYGATMSAWGGANSPEKVQELRSIGVHSTGSMWCLTAGAKELYENEVLREATVRDIEGNPIAVPWLPDHTYMGMQSLWGCLSHPAYKEFLRQRVREVMEGGADGLHIDDHLSTAHPVAYNGGCFCDSCMKAFTEYLIANSTPKLLKAAGVDSFVGFDYRNLIKQKVTTTKAYMGRQDGLPLRQVYLDFHLNRAAENVRELGVLAQEIAGHPITLSANTGLPNLPHIVVTPYLTHLVGEVDHKAEQGTKGLIDVVRAYRMAEALHKPLAATASGGDWAYVVERECENLVTLWIALSYACGQRLMAPNHQWCFTPEKGTHWYDGPVEKYAPLYKFVRSNMQLFDDFDTVGPLAAPSGIPNTFETDASRKAFANALSKGNPKPLSIGKDVWVFPRASADGRAVIHLINLRYSADSDQFEAQKDVQVRLLPGILKGRYTRAVVRSYDGSPYEVPTIADETGISMQIPELRLWSVVELH